MKKILFLAALVSLVFLSHPELSTAQSAVQFDLQAIEYQFGKDLVIEGKVVSGTALERADLILEAPGTPSFTGSANFTSDGEVSFVYNLAERPLPAFSTISYHFRLVFINGEEFTTQTFTLPYVDNRRDWQELKSGVFTVYWYQGDVPFAREVVDAAQKGRSKILDLLQQPADDREIDIFVYGSEEDLQATLSMSGQSWVAGHANPALGSVVVSLPPGPDQSLKLQRQVPHEITHIVLYRFMGSEYQYLPRWVNEGIASQMEFFPNPEQEAVLNKAQQEGRLIPFSQLCQSMPADNEQVLLAYAQVDSFLEYIQQKYGVTGIQAMISAYDQGVGCERGVEIALGTSLEALEREWKKTAFSSRTLADLKYLFMPWLLIVLLIIIPVLLVLIVRLYLDRNRIINEEGHD